MTRRPITIEFDGLLYWYRGWFDATEDRCSFCRELIADEETPILIWRDPTSMARLHVACGRRLLAAGKIGGAA
jgi:hypothetical protein